MSSTNFDTYGRDVMTGVWSYNASYAFKATLHTAALATTVNTAGVSGGKMAMTKYSQLANEITGTNYTAGGVIVTPTLLWGPAQASPVDNFLVNWSTASWANLTATGIQCMVIRAVNASGLTELTNGGLIMMVDNGSPLAPTANTFTFSVNNGTAVATIN